MMVLSEGGKIPAWIIIPIWIGLSGGLIVFNKYLFSTLGFPFPVFLTAYHMLVSSLGTLVLRHTTHLLDQVNDGPVNLRIWVRAILPLGVLFSFSLVLANMAYVHLSISFVQMLKAFIPVLVHLISVLCGLAEATRFTTIVLAMVSCGSFVAAAGEVRYSNFGLICQVLAVIIESARLVMIQFLLKGYKLSPLVSIYYYAPVCFVLIAVVEAFREGTAPFKALPEVGYFVLACNGAVAFSLNVAGVFLIDSAGSLVLTLAGVLKDVILITFSVLLLGAALGLQQAGGYVVALSGLLLFNLRDHPALDEWKQSANSGYQRLRNGQSASTSSWSIPRITGVATALTVIMATLWHEGYLGYLPGPFVDDVISSSIKFPIPYNMSSSHEWPVSNAQRSQFVMNATAAELIPAFDPLPDPSVLPLIAWVIVMNPGEVVKFAESLAHLSCYCLRHGIRLYIDYVLADAKKHFFTSRHYNVVKYLRHHQWVFFTDGDVLIADSSKTPRDILFGAMRDGIDVILPERGSAEVCACGYMIRNSPGGWAFLRRWLAWPEDGTNPNFDNGDLNELILAGLKPGPPNSVDGTGRMTKAEVVEAEKSMAAEDTECLNKPIPDWYVWRFMQCFQGRLRSHRISTPWLPYWDAELFAWTDALPTVKARVYREFGGFMRSSPVSNSRHYPERVENDWIYHLHKDSYLFNASMSLCNGDDWQWEPSADMDAFRKGVNGINPYSYHGCWNADGEYICPLDRPLYRPEELWPNKPLSRYGDGP